MPQKHVKRYENIQNYAKQEVKHGNTSKKHTFRTYVKTQEIAKTCDGMSWQ